MAIKFKMDYADEVKKRGLEHMLQPTPNSNAEPIPNQAETESSQVTIANNPSLGEIPPQNLGMRTIPNDFNPADIPPRNWIINKYIQGNYITLIAAAGATGKSIFTLTLAVSVALGKDLLDIGTTVQGNVLVINNEDDDVELDRRLAGIFKLYRIRNHEVNNRLFLKSGYGKRITISTKNGQTMIRSPDVDKIIAEIKRCDIKVLIIDPFVSTHQEQENDNSALDEVMSYYRQIASETGVAIVLVHHTRKNGDESDRFAGDVDSMRGASSTKDAARLCFTLAKMGEKSANDHGIEWRERHQLIRLDDAKNNFTLNAGKPRWLKLESVLIANGEWLGVPRAYDLPKPETSNKATAESKEHTIFSYIVRGVLAVNGNEGGGVKRPILLEQLLKETTHGKSKIEGDLKGLPIGSSKSRRVNVDGIFYRVHQVDGTHANAAKTVYVIVD
ncbi:AAA family ATPase [Colwellia sp. Arc7-D]|uniref:AAA family ATPase n=1 Tax=Colwellia sp. Arc7-D TaxID=2161872 RepID=UPI000D3420AB|nr:AAA family ATPase [Colwellia sp. Arc7-D]AWB58207.1 hypothetical protein DBO93_11940 [Colwellia sp. Arc7-D]